MRNPNSNPNVVNWLAGSQGPWLAPIGPGWLPSALLPFHTLLKPNSQHNCEIYQRQYSKNDDFSKNFFFNISSLSSLNPVLSLERSKVWLDWTKSRSPRSVWDSIPTLASNHQLATLPHSPFFHKSVFLVLQIEKNKVRIWQCCSFFMILLLSPI